MKETTLEEFLGPISAALGRRSPADPGPSPDPSFGMERERFASLSREELVERFELEAAAIGTAVSRATLDTLPGVLARQARAFEARRAVWPDDPRMVDLGLVEALTEEGVLGTAWDPRRPEQSIACARDADVGITFPFAGIATTATVAQHCDEKCGRSISLLPACHIAIVGTSTIVPHMIDVLERIDGARDSGELPPLPSSLVFVTGPSATSDIELVRVVGVHGPVKTAVILLEDGPAPSA
ncbi:hypothetical protein B5F40_11875 [Gordonibacter sp. An230]|uniref:LutC/YkgG family protein n=1 Tax=Gordonibacter sp. An230 TaxID=1965592 RepID=UPI000B3768D1|nr:lactate utilization protein C [Gordonibacter sp. An230]OUO88903.1 hypothetical protein B5F40_11875 [Gordonibacter sp. An230]